MTEEQKKIRAKYSYVGPGKFEGEPIYLAYFYDQVIEGCGESVGNGYCVEVEEEDREIFPELGDIQEICFYCDDNGFVNSCDREDLEEEEEYQDDEED